MVGVDMKKIATKYYAPQNTPFKMLYLREAD